MRRVCSRRWDGGRRSRGRRAGRHDRRHGSGRGIINGIAGWCGVCAFAQARARGTSSCVGPTPKHAGARRPLQVRTEGWNTAGLSSPCRLATVDTAARSFLSAGRSLVCIDVALLQKQKVDESVSAPGNGRGTDTSYCVRVSSDGFCAQTTPGQERKGTTAGPTLHICVIRCVRWVGAVPGGRDYIIRTGPEVS